MSFQARIPNEVKTEILDLALAKSVNALRRAKSQIRNVESWGTPDSFVNISYFDKAKNAIHFDEPVGLILTNAEAKLKDDVMLPKRKNILQSFLSLTEQDVVSAEKELNANIASSKAKALEELDIFA